MYWFIHSYNTSTDIDCQSHHVQNTMLRQNASVFPSSALWCRRDTGNTSGHFTVWRLNKAVSLVQRPDLYTEERKQTYLTHWLSWLSDTKRRCRLLIKLINEGYREAECTDWANKNEEAYCKTSVFWAEDLMCCIRSMAPQKLYTNMYEHKCTWEVGMRASTHFIRFTNRTQAKFK